MLVCDLLQGSSCSTENELSPTFNTTVNYDQWEPKFNSLAPDSHMLHKTPLPTPPCKMYFSTRLNWSLICTSKTINFSCSLHCSTSYTHSIIGVHQSSMMPNVYLIRATAVQTWSCSRQGMQVSVSLQHLILRAGLISFIIGCSGYYHALWHSAVADVAEVTLWCWRICLTSCKFQTLYGKWRVNILLYL